MMRAFKTFTAREINEKYNSIGKPFWQTRFHGRIIRDKRELHAKRQYIINNPANWQKDRNNHSRLYM